MFLTGERPTATGKGITQRGGGAYSTNFCLVPEKFIKPRI